MTLSYILFNFFGGMHTSGTYYRPNRNFNSQKSLLVSNQTQLGRNGLDPNFLVSSHEIMVFGISTAGVNARATLEGV